VAARRALLGVASLLRMEFLYAVSFAGPEQVGEEILEERQPTCSLPLLPIIH